MQIFKGIEETRAFISEEKKQNKRVGLVPTMGALHNGHLSLVKKSMSENQSTIVSIFVNPLQFNNPNDFDKYPKTVAPDINLLEQTGCQAAFIPEAKIMYEKPTTITLSFESLDKILEGKFRPGHFSGVAIVVAKFFNIIQPNVAYFGQKDFQQFLIIKQVVQEMNFPVQLRCEEIVREPDGLAMSSRNMRLSPSEREKASLLFKSLSQAKKDLKLKNMDQIRLEAEHILSENNIKLEYLELANRDSLQLLPEYDSTIPSLLLIAAYVGEVRLIDNIFV